MAMKTVSILGMVFLPATFVSAIFGSNFFNYQPGSSQADGFQMSDQFWIFWAVSVPLTALTFGLWHWWAGQAARGGIR
jgi:Mg2+ and Co2+ transporter CorA